MIVKVFRDNHWEGIDMTTFHHVIDNDVKGKLEIHFKNEKRPYNTFEPKILYYSSLLNYKTIVMIDGVRYKLGLSSERKKIVRLLREESDRRVIERYNQEVNKTLNF